MLGKTITDTVKLDPSLSDIAGTMEWQRLNRDTLVPPLSSVVRVLHRHHKGVGSIPAIVGIDKFEFQHVYDFHS